VVYEYLIGERWIDFRYATETIYAFFDRWPALSPPDGVRTIPPPEGSVLAAVTDLIHLNAAEAALVAEWGEPESGLQIPPHTRKFQFEPLRIPQQAAEFALFATDSGPFVGHDPRDNARLWDVTLLGSDASKLAWLSGSDSVDVLAEQFVDVVQRFAALYPTNLNAWGYGNRDAFGMRATLWRAKIAVLLNEKSYGENIFATYSAFR
jgi:hypothetical protein